MRAFITRLIITLLVIISIFIFIIFIQKIVDNGEALRFLGNRFIVATEDYEPYEINKYDIVIAHELTASEVKENKIIAYYTSDKEYKFAKVLSVDPDGIKIELKDSSEKTISPSMVTGLYFKEKIANFGKCILFFQSLKGFLISIGTVFIIIIIMSLFENIWFAIKKLFTKKA